MKVEHVIWEKRYDSGMTQLRAETLSDGSAVYNVILIPQGRDWVYAAPNQGKAISMIQKLDTILSQFD